MRDEKFRLNGFFTKSILFSVVLLFQLSLLGQSTYSLPPKASYNKGTVALNDSLHYVGKNIFIASDSVIFMVEDQRYSLHLDSVKYIEVRQGHSTYLGILGGFVAYGVTFIVSDLATDNDIADSGDAIKSGLVGGLIGGFIGAAIPPKKKYYPNGVQKE